MEKFILKTQWKIIFKIKKESIKNRKHYMFSVAEVVWIENGNKLNRQKLDKLRTGPFLTEKNLPNSIFLINCGPK